MRADRVAEIREIIRNLVVVLKLLGILQLPIGPFAGDGGAKDGWQVEGGREDDSFRTGPSRGHGESHMDGGGHLASNSSFHLINEPAMDVLQELHFRGSLRRLHSSQFGHKPGRFIVLCTQLERPAKVREHPFGKLTLLSSKLWLFIKGDIGSRCAGIVRTLVLLMARSGMT